MLYSIVIHIFACYLNIVGSTPVILGLYGPIQSSSESSLSKLLVNASFSLNNESIENSSKIDKNYLSSITGRGLEMDLNELIINTGEGGQIVYDTTSSSSSTATSKMFSMIKDNSSFSISISSDQDALIINSNDEPFINFSSKSGIMMMGDADIILKDGKSLSELSSNMNKVNITMTSNYNDILSLNETINENIYNDSNEINQLKSNIVSINDTITNIIIDITANTADSIKKINESNSELITNSINLLNESLVQVNKTIIIDIHNQMIDMIDIVHTNISNVNESLILKFDQINSTMYKERDALVSSINLINDLIVDTTTNYSVTASTFDKINSDVTIVVNRLDNITINTNNNNNNINEINSDLNEFKNEIVLPTLLELNNTIINNNVSLSGTTASILDQILSIETDLNANLTTMTNDFDTKLNLSMTNNTNEIKQDLVLMKSTFKNGQDAMYKAINSSIDAINQGVNDIKIQNINNIEDVHNKISNINSSMILYNNQNDVELEKIKEEINTNFTLISSDLNKNIAQIDNKIETANTSIIGMINKINDSIVNDVVNKVKTELITKIITTNSSINNNINTIQKDINKLEVSVSKNYSLLVNELSIYNDKSQTSTKELLEKINHVNSDLTALTKKHEDNQQFNKNNIDKVSSTIVSIESSIATHQKNIKEIGATIITNDNTVKSSLDKVTGTINTEIEKINNAMITSLSKSETKTKNEFDTSLSTAIASVTKQLNDDSVKHSSAIAKITENVENQMVKTMDALDQKINDESVSHASTIASIQDNVDASITSMKASLLASDEKQEKKHETLQNALSNQVSLTNTLGESTKVVDAKIDKVSQRMEETTTRTMAVENSISDITVQHIKHESFVNQSLNSLTTRADIVDNTINQRPWVTIINDKTSAIEAKVSTIDSSLLELVEKVGHISGKNEAKDKETLVKNNEIENNIKLMKDNHEAQADQLQELNHKLLSLNTSLIAGEKKREVYDDVCKTMQTLYESRVKAIEDWQLSTVAIMKEIQTKVSSQESRLKALEESSKTSREREVNYASSASIIELTKLFHELQTNMVVHAGKVMDAVVKTSESAASNQRTAFLHSSDLWREAQEVWSKAATSSESGSTGGKNKASFDDINKQKK